MVYSTCTISPLENERNVRYLLDRYPQFRLVPQTPHLGGPGLVGPGLLTSEEAALVQRFTPSTQDRVQTPGFFIAKFEKRPVA